MTTRLFFSIVVATVGAALASAQASDLDTGVRAAFESYVAPWLNHAEIQDAVRAQNAEHAALTDEEVLAFDQRWRADGGGAQFDEIMAKSCSSFMIDQQNRSGGLIVELFIVDLKGLNVCQTVITSDVFQGDEPKFQVPISGGASGEIIEEMEWDDEIGSFLQKISRTITDSNTGEVIGTVTAGLAIDLL